jgi:transitional endoplasmic reticulum ATPase
MADANAVDAVPYVTRKHFEEAFSCARKSVSQQDLGRFEEFRRKMDPAYAKKVGGAQGAPKINWPEDTTAQFIAGNDDDLYS